MIDHSLPSISKAIYAYLVARCGAQKYECWPTRDQICKDLKMSKKTYYKYRKYLVDLGVIEITKRRGGYNQFENNRFVLHFFDFPTDELMVLKNNSDEAVLDLVARQNPGEYWNVMRALVKEKRFHVKH